MLQHTLYQALRDNNIAPATTIDAVGSGKIQRFTVTGDSKDSKNGWYVAYPVGEGYAGAVGCWKRDVKGKFSTFDGKKLSAEEKRQISEAQRKAVAKMEKAREEAHEHAAATAEERWNKAKPAGKSHPYITAKQLEPHQLREDSAGNLLVPVFNNAGLLRSLQTISPKGAKKFLYEGETKGCYCVIGELGQVIAIVEGFATGSSVYQATGIGVVVAFSDINLEAVGQVIRRNHPAATIIFAADNDCETKGNPGLSKAKDAARAVNGRVAVPFDGTAKKCDFNDVHINAGFEAVKFQLRSAKRVSVEKAPEVKIKTLGSLLKKDLPPTRWAVAGLLPEGSAVLAGASKARKTLMALNLCISIATGGKALGAIDVDKGKALYIAMEDHDRRLQGRALQMIDEDDAQVIADLEANFDYAYQWPRFDQGGLDAIDDWLLDNPTAKIVVIDTYARVKPPAKRGGYDYMDDYHWGGQVTAMANKHNVCILIIHHTRKETGSDFLQDISGTTGLPGSLNTILVLKRERNENNGVLYITGHDVDENELAVIFDPVTAVWNLAGEAKQVFMPEEHRAIVSLLQSTGPLSSKEIAQNLYPGVEINRDSKQWRDTRVKLHRMYGKGLIQQLENKRYFVCNTCNTGNTRNTGNTCNTPKNDQENNNNNHNFSDCVTRNEGVLQQGENVVTRLQASNHAGYSDSQKCVTRVTSLSHNFQKTADSFHGLNPTKTSGNYSSPAIPSVLSVLKDCEDNPITYEWLVTCCKQAGDASDDIELAISDLLRNGTIASKGSGKGREYYLMYQDV